PAPGQSTWFYSFTSGTKPAISHVTFAMMCDEILILDAGMWNGTDYNSRMYKAGKPEPGSFPGTPKGDPTTGVIGLKFDLGFNDNSTRHYYFTVNGNYASAPMQVALKAGKGFNSGYLCGPDQECAGPQLSSVGDYVWLDANGNGIQDNGETGVQGVTVYLLAANGDLLEQTVTDADGLYLFDDLVDGDYRIRFDLPAGYLFTFVEAGEDFQTDSDADPLTGDSGIFTLPSATNIRDIDAGLILSTASIKLTKTGVFHPGTTDPWAFCTVFGPAHDFNALIFGDFTASGGDTDGRLAVGGNAGIPMNYSVGIVIDGHPLPDYFGGATDIFIVGGNLNDGAWGVNGNIVYGGERTGLARWMSNGNLLRKVTPVTFRNDGNVPSDGSGMTFDYLRAKLADRSALYACLANRGVVSVDSSTWQLDLVADDPVLNVFNLETSIWNGQSRGIFITAPSNSTVLVNVSGEFVGITNSSMNVSGTSHENVLINYVNATTVATAGFKHTASVMALHADAAFSGGSIDGRAVFGGDVVTTNGFEFHNYYFTGVICTGDEPEDTPPRITYSFTVENTGNVPLYNVTINDPLVTVTGALAELAAAAEDTNSFSAVYYLSDEELAIGADVTNTAETVAATATGNIVSDTDTCVVVLPDPEPEETENPPQPENPPAWAKADFVIRAVDITPSPTVAGTRFRAAVRVANEGDIPGDAGSIELWSGNDTYTAAPATAPDATIAVGNLNTGQTVVVEFNDLRAPFVQVRATYHAMAVVNRAGAVPEYSTGNNHGGATYTLEPLTVNVEPCTEGMRLSWNSVPGYYYFLERSDSLGQPFHDIADNLPSTPPLNVYIDADIQTGAAFYRVWGYKP
ncbi:MAG: choice-of-anchor A family protein, partial [Kiritimatiellae bacterium]|nr:choice-of-anchor A family protein [Kiritimatiellia bacterium]